MTTTNFPGFTTMLEPDVTVTPEPQTYPYHDDGKVFRCDNCGNQHVRTHYYFDKEEFGYWSFRCPCGHGIGDLAIPTTIEPTIIPTNIPTNFPTTTKSPYDLEYHDDFKIFCCDNCHNFTTTHKYNHEGGNKYMYICDCCGNLSVGNEVNVTSEPTTTRTPNTANPTYDPYTTPIPTIPPTVSPHQYHEHGELFVCEKCKSVVHTQYYDDIEHGEYFAFGCPICGETRGAKYVFTTTPEPETTNWPTITPTPTLWVTPTPTTTPTVMPRYSFYIVATGNAYKSTRYAYDFYSQMAAVDGAASFMRRKFIKESDVYIYNQYDNVVYITHISFDPPTNYPTTTPSVWPTITPTPTIWPTPTPTPTYKPVDYYKAKYEALVKGLKELVENL